MFTYVIFTSISTISSKRANTIPFIFGPQCKHGKCCRCLLPMLCFHFYSQLVQLLVCKVIRFLQTEPEFTSEVSKTMFVFYPTFVKILRSIESILYYLNFVVFKFYTNKYMIHSIRKGIFFILPSIHRPQR